MICIRNISVLKCLIIYFIKSDEHEEALQKRQESHNRALDELKQASDAEAQSRFVNTVTVDLYCNIFSDISNVLHKCDTTVQ